MNIHTTRPEHRPRIDRDGLKAAALDRLADLVEAIKGKPEKRNAATWRGFKSGAGFRIVTRGPKAGVWADGGGAGGDVFDLCADLVGVSPRTDWGRFSEALAAYLGYQGAALDPTERDRQEATRKAKAAKQAREDEAEREREAAGRKAALAAFQRAALPLSHPLSAPALAYLAGRNLPPLPLRGLAFIPPGALPSLAGVPHREAPALLILCQDATGAVVAAQRIILLPDGSDRDRDKGKLFTASVSANPFRIAPRADDATGGALCLAEGLESALAVWSATGAETWVCFAADGLAKAIEAAPEGRRVIVWSDRDAPGNPALKRVNEACDALALRHADAWRAVVTPDLIALPSGAKDGADAADVIKTHGPDGVLRMLRDARKLAPPDIPPPRPDSLDNVADLEAPVDPAPMPEGPAAGHTRPAAGSLWPDRGAETWEERQEALARQDRVIRGAILQMFELARVNRRADAERAEIRAEANAATDTAMSGPDTGKPNFESAEAVEVYEKARRRRLYWRELRRILKARGLSRLPRPEAGAPLDLVTGAAGTGKTRETLRTIAAHGAGIVTDYAAPDLGKAKEARADYDRIALEHPDAPPSFLWSGRGAPNPEKPSTTMCERSDLANLLASLRHSPRKILCPSCPLAAGCAYLRQEREAQAMGADGRGLVVFGAHAGEFSPGAGRPRAGAVILDEDVRGAASSNKQGLSEGAFRIAPEALEHDGDDLKETAREALAYAQANAARLLAGIWGAFMSGAPAPALKKLATPDDWRKLSRGLEILAAPQPVNTLQDDAKIIAALKKRNETRPPFASQAMLARRIAERLEAQPDEPNIAGAMLEEWDAKGPGAAHPPRVLVTSWAAPKIADHVPILALDATGDADIWRRILRRAPDRLTHHHIPIERHAEIIQVSRRTFPKSAFHLTALEDEERAADDDAKAGRELVEGVLRVLTKTGQAAGEGRVFVACQKDIKTALGLGRFPWIEAMHYNALRGRNGAEDCADAVVIGRPQPSCAAISLMAGALAALTGEAFTPAKDYVQRPRARRMRDGSPSVETVSAHPDPLGDALLRQIRESEVMQGIDRARLTRPASPDAPRKRVIVLCALPLDMTVDAVMTWDQLQGTSRIHEALRDVQGHGRRVLRLSPIGLVADAPGIFGTPKAAERWIEKGGLDWLSPLWKGGAGAILSYPPISYIVSYRKGGDNSCEGLTFAKLRLQGVKGGPLTPAIILASAPEARAVAERDLGPLQAFEIVASFGGPQPEPPAPPPPEPPPPEADDDAPDLEADAGPWNDGAPWPDTPPDGPDDDDAPDWGAAVWTDAAPMPSRPRVVVGELGHARAAPWDNPSPTALRRGLEPYGVHMGRALQASMSPRPRADWGDCFSKGPT